MLNWYKKLYVGDNARKKKKQLIRKISMGAGVVDVYLITLASNPRNQLDIFSANELEAKSQKKTLSLDYRTLPRLWGSPGDDRNAGAKNIRTDRYSPGAAVAGTSDWRGEQQVTL